jgi:hypothetical protein
MRTFDARDLFMAIVRMSIPEAADGFLPETCMKCGARADHWVRKKLIWQPSWVWILLLGGLLPFLIVALILTKRATLIAPLCTAHRRHWVIRNTLAVVGLIVLIGLGVLLFLVAHGPRRRADNLTPFLVILLLVGIFAWLVALITMRLTSIRPLEITDRDVILQGVAEQFADDFDAGIDDEDDRPPPPKRSRRAWDDDD